MTAVATTKRTLLPDGGMEICFQNKVTGATETRQYRTEAAGKAAETRFHNRMTRLYGHLIDGTPDKPTNATINTQAAHTLAQDINRLADLLDPYGFRDYVSEQFDGDLDKADQHLALDLLTGNTKPYVEWLQEQVTDENNSNRDRARAADRLARLLTWIDKQ